MADKKKVVALIVAGGSSSRMNGIDKITCLLENVPVICRTCKVFEDSSFIDEYIVVASEDNLVKVESLLPKTDYTKLTKVIKGGSERYESVMNGLDAIDDCDIVMIHDGARPLVTGDIIERGYNCALKHDACCCGIAVTDTVKQVERNVIEKTLNRNKIWLAQTPQVFRFDTILQAYSTFSAESVTDDTMMVERLRKHVYMFEGSKENIKLTDQNDLKLASAIIKARN